MSLTRNHCMVGRSLKVLTEMKILAIIVYLFGASHAIPLVAQRLLSASNSNEVLLGVVNPNIPQGGAMNLFVPGMYQPQLQQKMAGLPQVPFNVRSGLNSQLPNQVMSYVVPYGIPQKQGQIQVYPLYPAQQQPAQTLPKQLGNESPTEQMQIYPLYPAQQQPGQTLPKQFGNESPIEQVFGCVPQVNGEMAIPSGGLQVPTRNPDDPLFLDENSTPVPSNQEDKVTPKVLNAP